MNSKIAGNSISNTKIQDNVVTMSKIAANSIDGSKMLDNSITAAGIGTDAVRASDLAEVTNLHDELSLPKLEAVPSSCLFHWL